MVELECLAIIRAIMECQHHHLLGCPGPLTVVMDQRPLLGVFGKDLPSLKSTRLQRLRRKVTDYQFNVTWAPGMIYHVHQSFSTPPEDGNEDREVAECFVITANLAVHDKITPYIDDNYSPWRKD